MGADWPDFEGSRSGEEVAVMARTSPGHSERASSAGFGH